MSARLKKRERLRPRRVVLLAGFAIALVLVVVVALLPSKRAGVLSPPAGQNRPVSGMGIDPCSGYAGTWAKVEASIDNHVPGDARLSITRMHTSTLEAMGYRLVDDRLFIVRLDGGLVKNLMLGEAELDTSPAGQGEIIHGVDLAPRLANDLVKVVTEGIRHARPAPNGYGVLDAPLIKFRISGWLCGELDVMAEGVAAEAFRRLVAEIYALAKPDREDDAGQALDAAVGRMVAILEAP